MSLSRRRVLQLSAGALALRGATLASPVRAAAFLEDARTARGVTLRLPRTTLAECLRVLSAAGGVSLEAAPELQREALVGYVPRRPLRETMSALEALFDATWSGTGTPVRYRLQRDPVKSKAALQARERLLQEYRKNLDAQAAAAAKAVKTDGLPTLDTPRRETFVLLLWNELTPAQKLQVLRGETVTASIPEARAQPMYELAVAIAGKEKAKLTGSLLATFDLDDRSELAIPTLRTRATGMRENSIVGAIHAIEFAKMAEPPRPKVPDGGPVLPLEIGTDGSVSGTRDEMVLGLGEGGGVPILSRQRAQGGNGPGVQAGGRPAAQVAADLAVACDARLVPNSRGFLLLRSNTEALDASGSIPEAAQAYLKRRPATGFVPLPALAELAALSLLQLAVLQRSNLCTVETAAAREIYTLLDFYRSLTPELRQALFSPKGVEATRLSHAQLHALLGDKRLRANWEVHAPLQSISDLSFRMEETRQDDGPALSMVCLRKGLEMDAPIVVPMPEVEEEERAEARR